MIFLNYGSIVVDFIVEVILISLLIKDTNESKSTITGVEENIHGRQYRILLFHKSKPTTYNIKNI